MTEYVLNVNSSFILKGNMKDKNLEPFFSRLNQKYVTIYANDLSDLLNRLILYLAIPDSEYNDICLYAISDENNELLFAWINPREKLSEFNTLIGCKGYIYDFVNYKVNKVHSKNPGIKPKTLKDALGRVPFISNLTLNSLNIENCKYLNYKEKSDKADEIVSIKPVEKSEESKLLECLDLEMNNNTTSSGKVLKDKLDICNSLSYLEDSRYKDLFIHLNEAFMLISELKESMPELLKTVSLCDLETLNVLHNIELEFDKMNAYHGYLASEKIHDIRVKRRIAKDKISILEELYEP